MLSVTGQVFNETDLIQMNFFFWDEGLYVSHSTEHDSLVTVFNYENFDPNIRSFNN